MERFERLRPAGFRLAAGAALPAVQPRRHGRIHGRRQFSGADQPDRLPGRPVSRRFLGHPYAGSGHDRQRRSLSFHLPGPSFGELPAVAAGLHRAGRRDAAPRVRREDRQGAVLGARRRLPRQFELGDLRLPLRRGRDGDERLEALCLQGESRRELPQQYAQRPDSVRDRSAGGTDRVAPEFQDHPDAAGRFRYADPHRSPLFAPDRRREERDHGRARFTRREEGEARLRGCGLLLRQIAVEKGSGTLRPRRTERGEVRCFRAAERVFQLYRQGPHAGGKISRRPRALHQQI